MPSTDAPTTTEEPKTVTLVLTDAQKAAINDASGSKSKKVLYWILGILGVLLLGAIIVAVILGSRGKANLAKPIVDKVKAATARSDMEAKIEAAKASGAEKAVLDELDRIKEIDDDYERSKRLAEIL